MADTEQGPPVVVDPPVAADPPLATNLPQAVTEDGAGSPREDSEQKIKQDETAGEKRNNENKQEALESADTVQNELLSKPSDAEPISSDRPKSSDSRGVFVSAKGKRKKKMIVDPNTHIVTITVTISMAVPTAIHAHDEDQPDIKDMVKKEKRMIEKPRPQRWYHLEYYLLPDEDELIKSDVVSYGPAVKIFTEHDSRVLRTWQEGDLTWISWIENNTVNVSRDLLMKLFNHTVELRIWDETDKMKTNSKVNCKLSTSARWDRPLNFKLPSTKPEQAMKYDEKENFMKMSEEEKKGVKGIVLRQSKSYTKMQPKKCQDTRAIPTQVTFCTKRKEEKNDAEKPPSPRGRAESPTPKTLVGVSNKKLDSQDGRGSFSRLGRLAGADPAPSSSPRGRESVHSKMSSDKMSQKSHTSKKKAKEDKNASPSGRNVKSAESAGSRIEALKEVQRLKRQKKSEAAHQAAQQAAEQIFKFGTCMIPVRMANFFTGVKSITSRLTEPVMGVEDCFISLKVDGPIMSEKQRLELNPMIIKIHSCTNLPDSPITYPELKMRCKPAYCKYEFFKQPVHSSEGREHARNIYWDDVNVVLTGTLDPSELRQYLNGPPLEIEVHDRDRREEDVNLKPTLFGDDLEDEKISNVGTITSRRTLHNPFTGRNKPWDPYGTAKVDLSELLLGHKYLHIKVPLHSCGTPEVLGSAEGSDGKLVGFPGAVDGPVDRPISGGHYVSSNTMMKIKVELAHPLTTPDKVADGKPIESTRECPFGRIVFIFDYKNTTLLHQLQNLVTDVNAEALELDDMPQHVINAALSTYKLSMEQQQSRTLNIITGFQVMDSVMHLFMLEGLHNRAIKTLWNLLPKQEKSDVKVLYNSDMNFSERLYGPLDVDLCRVKLHESLTQIIQQPLLYVRDMVPKACFEALIRIYELTKLDQMRSVVRNDLFPKADMVISMSKEFGVPLTQADFEELQPEEEKQQETEVQVTHYDSFIRETSRLWTPIDHYNKEYVERLVAREQQHNFIYENKEDIRNASEINKKEKEMNKVPTIHADVNVAHNYSSQTLNSTELAKEKLRQMLAEHPDTRYTYCQDYHHSMTVVPVNVEALKKQAQEEAKARWKTDSGWIYPGMKTMQECNVHPGRPNTARVEELTEPWRENILHVGMLQPPLERDCFPWDARQLDMELYRRPKHLFGDEPVTIHLAGQKLKKERLDDLRKDFEKWRSKQVVDDTRQYFHRCLMETELNDKGQNQVDKLQGLLKDNPEKLSLRRSGLRLRNVPPLNVVLNPSVDIEARLMGLPTHPAVEGEGYEKIKGFKPGPFEAQSWNLERNKIPAYDYEHDLFMDRKGFDFNPRYKERNKLWKRTINPLKDDERDNHLFRIPDDYQRFGKPRPVFDVDPTPPTVTETKSILRSPGRNTNQSGVTMSADPVYRRSVNPLQTSSAMLTSNPSLPKVVQQSKQMETLVN
ncbi:uncharacterized protein LOC110446691 isoform X2 [Mizuhopecten yessoensis]|uniref:uncharacterized protein LOC110446691 isoform X2 n=1 Tax=Mizuhopecten yessoensis TaxID=6573 RepID=UPI000B45C261|nr:uncharacterized protein LOC110446691 isoform X2 [Mizuhopecten yessoensis]